MMLRRDADIIFHHFNCLPRPVEVEEETKSFIDAGNQLVQSIKEHTILVDRTTGSTIQDMHHAFGSGLSLEAFREQLVYFNLYQEGDDIADSSKVDQVARTRVLIVRPFTKDNKLDTKNWEPIDTKRYEKLLNEYREKILTELSDLTIAREIESDFWCGNVARYIHNYQKKQGMWDEFVNGSPQEEVKKPSSDTEEEKKEVPPVTTVPE
jgi:hypothetical protein